MTISAPVTVVPALLERLDDARFADLPGPVTAAGRALLAAQRALVAFSTRHPADPYTGRLLPDDVVERLVAEVGDALGRGEEVPEDLLGRVTALRTQQQHAQEVLEVHRGLLTRWQAAWRHAVGQHADEVLSSTLGRQLDDLRVGTRDLIGEDCSDEELSDLAQQLAALRYLQGELLQHVLGDRADDPLLAGAAWFPDWSERWPAWAATVLLEERATGTPIPPPWPGEEVAALRYAVAAPAWSPTAQELLSAYDVAKAAWKADAARQAQEATLVRLKGDLERLRASSVDVGSPSFQRSPSGRELLDAGLIAPVPPASPRRAPRHGADGAGSRRRGGG